MFRVILLVVCCTTVVLVEGMDQHQVQPLGNPVMQMPVAAPEASRTYVLGPGDELAVQCLDAEEFNGKPVRITDDGFVELPMVGRIKAAGLTVTQFETEFIAQLRTYIKQPQVTVNVAEFRSQPVTILGAVNTPGEHFLTGRKTLLEILSLAGGLKPDAGYAIKIVRKNEYGRIPLASAKEDETGQFSVAEVNLHALINGAIPDDNIEVRPHDVITVPTAEIVYVIGEVRKPGGFTITTSKSVTVLQAVSMAEGLLHSALASKAKILRPTDDPAHRNEIDVDLDNIMRGRKSDVAMHPEDILFVPDNKVKAATLRALETVIQTGSGIVIYGRY